MCLWQRRQEMEISRAEMSEAQPTVSLAYEEFFVKIGFTHSGLVPQLFQVWGGSGRHSWLWLLHVSSEQRSSYPVNGFHGDLEKNLGVDSMLHLTFPEYMGSPFRGCLWAEWEVCDEGAVIGHQSFSWFCSSHAGTTPWEDTITMCVGNFRSHPRK